MTYLFELAYYIINNKNIISIALILILIGFGIFFIVDFNIWNKTGRSLWNKGNKQNKRK